MIYLPPSLLRTNFTDWRWIWEDNLSMCGFSTFGLVSSKAALAHSRYVFRALTYSVGMLLLRAACHR